MKSIPDEKLDPDKRQKNHSVYNVKLHTAILEEISHAKPSHTEETMLRILLKFLRGDVIFN